MRLPDMPNMPMPDTMVSTSGYFMDKIMSYYMYMQTLKMIKIIGVVLLVLIGLYIMYRLYRAYGIAKKR